MKHCVLSLLLVALFVLPARAQESGLTFLRIGTDAAAAAMGDAYVAVSRDAFATYWNAAGLAAAPSNAVAASYHSWIADTRTYALAARFRAGEQGGLGLFITAMGKGDLEARTRPGAPEGTFSAQFMSAGLAYGRTLGPLRAGVTVKYLAEEIYTDQAYGYALDVGVQADLFDGGLMLGAALQNVGEMSELDAEASRLPRMLRVGAAAAPFHIRTADDDAEFLRVMLTGEVVHLFPSETTQLHVGAEARVLEVIDLRGGYITNDPLRGPTLGLGLGYEAFRFDYAFQPFEGGFEGPGHLLTLTYNW